MGLSVFFDTYAFHEMIVGNENYAKFELGYAIITTKSNLMELFYTMLLKYPKEVAETYFDKFAENCVLIDDETIKDAMLFRFANKSKKMSYIDCIGYTLACQRGIPFVTGDKQFKDLRNVEFLK